jgi:uncharacterized protein YkwD
MLKSSLAGAAIALIAIGGHTTEVSARPVYSVAPATVRNLQARATQVSESISEIEQSIFRQINEYRANKGLPALTWNADMAEQARQHSANMANGSIPFGHLGFDQRAKTLNKALGYEAVSENVAYMTTRANMATIAAQSWINSEKHRKNIEGKYTLTGIGVSRSETGHYYFTEMFVRK